eukprot:2840466-Prymnesium_polylepis.2
MTCCRAWLDISCVECPTGRQHRSIVFVLIGSVQVDPQSSGAFTFTWKSITCMDPNHLNR